MKRRDKAGRRGVRGGALIETVAGLAIFIPIVLFLVDVVAMVLAQTANDALAKSCARAAAGKADQAAGQTAVDDIRSHYTSTMLQVNSATITEFNDVVRVETKALFTFPVPVPLFGISSQNFTAEAVEPVVGKLAN